MTNAVNGFDPTKTSQSSARLFRNSNQNRGRNYGGGSGGNIRNQFGPMRFGNILDEFENGLRDGLMEAARKSEFGKNIKRALDNLVNELGVESIGNLPGKYANDVYSMIFIEDF